MTLSTDPPSFPLAAGASADGNAGVPPGSEAAHLPLEVYRVGLQLVGLRWSTLFVTESEPSHLGRAVADAGAAAARILDLPRIQFVDAHGATHLDVDRIRAEIKSAVSAGARVVVAIDPPPDNSPATVLLMSADAVLLLVRLGATEFSFVKSIVDIVGRERILGCVAIH